MDLESIMFGGDNAWRKRARCGQPDAQPPDYFSKKAADIEKCKAYCEPCPVRVACLEYALVMVDGTESAKIVSTLGVWGGMDGAQRVIIRNQRAAEVAEREEQAS